MSRRFPDFLKAYEDFADDGFVPSQFNTWIALSIVAAALERKVWLTKSAQINIFPNIYTLFISMPGDGKSTALNRGIDLLRDMNELDKKINFLPNKVTGPALITSMKKSNSFIERTPTGEITHKQNAAYFWSSEGSLDFSDTNKFGEFFSALTAFYDCPKSWDNKTNAGGTDALINVCMNVVAAVTFDHLSKIINDSNILGGFASRMIYVVSRNKEVQTQELQSHLDDKSKSENKEYRDALIEDLKSISEMVGPMYATTEFSKAWREWYAPFERNRRQLPSEKLQSIMSRAPTNLLKIAMILSACESDTRELNITHWDRAIKLVMPLYDEIPHLFTQAKANSSDRSSANISTMILYLASKGSMTIEKISSLLVINGYHPFFIERHIKALISADMLAIDEDGIAKVIGNPNDNF